MANNPELHRRKQSFTVLGISAYILSVTAFRLRQKITVCVTLTNQCWLVLLGNSIFCEIFSIVYIK